MKKIVISKYGNSREAFQLEDEKKPAPGDFEVLVQVEGFGLNYADVMARQGLYKEAPKPPFTPGYEIVGTVLQQGKEVPQKYQGRRVVAFTRFGGYAEQAVSDCRGAAIIGDAISGGEACALATQYCTAYYMTEYISNIHQGEMALIHACAGGVGTALTQLCKRKGLTVVGLCSSEDKISYLKELGVDYPINHQKTDYSTFIETNLGIRKIDYIFNAVSGPSFKKDMKLLAFGGKLFCYGGSSRSGKKSHIGNDVVFLLKTGFVSPLFMMMKSQGVIGVNMLRVAENKIEVIGKCLHALHRLWENGEIKPRVGGTFNAGKIAEAHDLLESRQSMGKIYVCW